MMHQAYGETSPVPKSWDEGPPVDSGGASAGADFGREGRAQEGRGASSGPDKKESPGAGPRTRKLRRPREKAARTLAGSVAGSSS